MTKSDGTQITVKFDSSYKITGTETGGPGGHRPQKGSSSDSSSSTINKPKILKRERIELLSGSLFYLFDALLVIRFQLFYS
jgi:hypothetical protein